MYFKRLEMHGFKSFAEPVVIDFHEGITCIVGPNGSGKSNISDAIRWALGEQSPKALRGGKMQEVIFNGTESRKPRGMAEVTLVIDNSTGLLDIEYKEVAITRRMYRSGESEYLINSNPCRLKDIRELIMDTGIGVDGYSIIGQGKISDIVSNKPESRREIFEEAAGIVAYKTRKQEAVRKLDGTRNNLERIDDIVGEIEGRIGGLKEDSEKAQRYLELKERYRELEINITLRNIENAAERSRQYKQEIQELEEQLRSAGEKKRGSDRESQELQKRSAALDTVSEKNHEKMVRTIEEINSITGESKLNREKLANLAREEDRLDGEIDDLTVRIDRLGQETEELKSRKKEIEDARGQAEKCLEERVLLYNSITSETSRFTEIIDDSNEKIISLNGEAASKRSEAKSYESYKGTLESRAQQIADENRKLEKDTAEYQKVLEQAREGLSRAEARKRKLASENNEKTLRCRKLEEKERSLRGAAEELRIRNNREEARLRTIEEMEQNYEGYNTAVKYIMRCGIRGIEGVVGEMMEVPRGYETAIETALGAAMQNIIVADDDSARKAITALKVNRSGRLTFLPVGSIRGRRIQPDARISGQKGYRGMGVDLIEFDERYQQIFEYLLGRVAVVDDLNAAIAMSRGSRQGIRFVTLDGEIINTSGAITGGKYKNQSANLLERKNEIERLKQNITHHADALEEKVRELQQTLDEIEELKQGAADAEQEMRELELQTATSGEKIAGGENKLADAGERMEKNRAELLQIRKELKDMDELISRMMTESRAAESEIEKIGKKVEDLTAEHQARRGEVADAGDAITQARIDVRTWEEKASNNAEMLERISGDLAALRKQSREKEQQLIALRQERGELTAGYRGSDTQVLRLEKERTELEENGAAISREKAQIAERLQLVAEELAGAEETINSVRDQKYQMEIRQARNETQMDNMKDKLWEEFEISYAQAKELRKEDFAMTASVRESRELRKELKEIGDVNVGAIAEYEQVSQRYSFLTEQRSDVVTALKELESIIDDLDRTITKTFKDNFDKVEINFEEVFRELFGGGHAELRMENENDPLESGIDIVAQPPGKRLQNINLMSGGEKTMTAIALMFAVLKTKPTPFCILDEVEAALDDENIDKFSGYLKNFTQTQFALITHQKATMEHADVLYGITMPERGVSKLLSLRMGDYDPEDFAS